jgi:hypothetical protein
MGDTKGGSGLDIGRTSRGISVVAQSSMDDLIGALTMFMQQQRTILVAKGPQRHSKGLLIRLEGLMGRISQGF